MFIIQYRRKPNKPWHHISGSEDKNEAIRLAKETITGGEVMVVDSENWNIVWKNK